MVLLCAVELLPEPGFSAWRLLWLGVLLRRRGAVLRVEVLFGRANCGAWPASDEVVVPSEGTTVRGELVIAEELTGFPKLGLEACSRLPEDCRKASGGNVWTICRDFSATGCSAKR